MDYSIIFLVVGLAAGFAIGYLLKKNKIPIGIVNDENFKKLEIENQSLLINNQNLKDLISQTSLELEKLKTINNTLTIDFGESKGKLEKSREYFADQKQKIEEFERSNKNLSDEASTLREQIKNLEKRIQESKVESEELHKKFATEFENLANKILDEKTAKFTVQNKENLSQLLNPFQEKIKEFEKKVETSSEKGTKENIELLAQVKQLADLNLQMRTDAQNLTNALKGDNKQQGNWGELILEKVLERSGLTEGIEYKLQFSTTDDSGTKIMPDVVIKLPEDKHIIIDSKVSLKAYTDYVNENDEVLRDSHLKLHIASIKNHIKLLSEKSYHSGKGINSPEFVLLFIPIESSFSAIIQHENDIWNYAWNQKIVLVSPSTLLATLRTIASVWKQEKQNANSIEIARLAGAMHKKFVDFVSDMEEIEGRIEQSQKAYSSAMNKLKDGNGNLIKSSEKLLELGVKSEKKLPSKFIDQGE